VHRTVVALTICLAIAPHAVDAQALTVNSASGSGDCSGTSFHQGSDASGRYLAAEWAAASQFPVPINRGRVRCMIRYNVTVPAGYRIVIGVGSSAPTRMATAQLMALRLNGSTSRVLVESALAIDGGAASNASGTFTSGPMTSAVLAQDRPSGSATLESICATSTKTSFLITAVADAATASNYVVPWPPEPYAQREVASMSSYRLFYSVAACAPGRTAIPQAEVIRPPR
jgi:hypothetical protein